MKRKILLLLIITTLCSCQRSITTSEQSDISVSEPIAMSSSQSTKVATQTDINSSTIEITQIENKDMMYYSFLSEIFDFSEFPVFDHRVYFYDINMDGNLEFIALGSDDYANVHLRIYSLNEDLPVYKTNFTLYNSSLYSRFSNDILIWPEQVGIYFDNEKSEYFILFESAYTKDTDIVLYSVEKISFYENEIIQENIVEFEAAPLRQNDNSIDDLFIYKNLFMHKESYPVGHVKLSELSVFNDELEEYLNQYELVDILDFSEKNAYTDETTIVEMIEKHSSSFVSSKIDNISHKDMLYFWNNQYYDIEKTTKIRVYYGDKYGMPNLNELEIFPNLNEIIIFDYNTDDILDLSPLIRCKSLRIININVEKSKSLSELQQIEFLFGSFTISSVNDFNQIKRMKQLKRLSFSAQSDESNYFDFMVGYENENIEWIDFYGTEDQLEIVKKSFPNLTFVNFVKYEITRY